MSAPYIKGDSDAAALLDAMTRSARVARYHTEPVLHPQSVGEHTYGVMWFAVILSDGRPSGDLMFAALAHDTAEHEFGDVPSPTKRLAGVKEKFDAMEDGYMKGLGVFFPTLCPADKAILKLSDLLDGMAYCAAEAMQGNRLIERAFSNFTNYTALAITSFEDSLPPATIVTARAIFDHYRQEYVRVHNANRG